MCVTLVACCYERGNFAYPLGTLSVLTALKAKGCEAGIDSHSLADDPAAAARNTRGEIVGCSVYLWNRAWFDAFLRELKRRRKPPVVFAGGPEVTANPGSFSLGKWDFLALGEGEECVPRAIAEVESGRVPTGGDGIVTRTSAITASCPEDLSTLPSVLLSRVADPFLASADTVLWELTRGCPFHCGFCFESKGVRSVRHYPMERIEREVDYLVSHGVRNVFVLDPTFNMDAERTKKILRLLLEKAPDIHFIFENRAELLDEETADLFSRLKCSLQIGMQSATEETLRVIGRAAEKEKFLRGVRLLDERGVTFGLDLIIGLPKDTLRSFFHSLDVAISLRPSNIDIFPLSLLPGTALAENAASLGLVAEEENPYRIRRTREMSEEDIREALRLKEACDIFYTKGQSSMYFATLCDTLALSAHELLSRFADYLDERGREGDVYEMQDTFISLLLDEEGKSHLRPVLASLMELYQGIAFLEETGESPVVYLSYDPNDLACLAQVSAEEFFRSHRRRERRLFLTQDGEGTVFFHPA